MNTITMYTYIKTIEETYLVSLVAEGIYEWKLCRIHLDGECGEIKLLRHAFSVVCVVYSLWRALEVLVLALGLE